MEKEQKLLEKQQKMAEREKKRAEKLSKQNENTNRIVDVLQWTSETTKAEEHVTLEQHADKYRDEWANNHYWGDDDNIVDSEGDVVPNLDKLNIFPEEPDSSRLDETKKSKKRSVSGKQQLKKKDWQLCINFEEEK